MGIKKDFQDFILRGNVIQLAIAFVMGAAFTLVVNAFVTDLVDPLIGAAGGTGSLKGIAIVVGPARFLVGDFLSAIINFLIVAMILFLAIVYPLLLYEERKKARQPPAAPTTKECPYCVSAIPLKATRCPHCTSTLSA